MTKETKQALDVRFADEMAESFGDLHALGVIDETTYKRTLRDLNREAAAITGQLLRPALCSTRRRPSNL